MNLLHVESDDLYAEKIQNTLLKSGFGIQWVYQQKKSFPLTATDISQYQCLLISINSHAELRDFLTLATQNPTLSEDIPIVVLSTLKDPHSLATVRAEGVTECFYKDLAPLKISFYLRELLHARLVNALGGEGLKEGQNLFAGKTLQRVANLVAKFVESEAKGLLVTGESGTGKEVVVEILRRFLEPNTPFVTVNCASICKELLHSELFGHKKGAFTGAQEDKKGLICAANKGWIFLDELARLPLEAQAALLRTLENGEIRPVGSNQVHFVNVRVVAATNENLDVLVKKGEFRQDLLQRLKTYEIRVPSIRQRSLAERQSILEFLLARLNQKVGRGKSLVVAEEAKSLLLSYDWRKGNIREMWNVLQGSALNALGEQITVGSLPNFFCREIVKLREEENLLHK